MKFLLVDDNEMTLEIEKLMLESCGLEVMTAGSGTEAVELAAEHSFFMIFMDIHMPEMDGFTAAELIRRKDAEVIMIALSADEIPESEAAFIRSGMNGSMLKPLRIESVKELLSRYMKAELTAESVISADDVFGFEELLAVMKNEKAVYRLVNQFLTVHGKDCTELNENIAEGNMTGAREILHNVIGISGNMFCKPLYEASCRLSAEVKRGSHDSLEAFNAIWEETIARLTEHRRLLSDSDSEAAEAVDWNRLREEFFSLCEDFDVAAVDLFSENTLTFRTNMDPENFRKLKKAAMKYDFMWICDNMEVLNV